MLLLKAALLLLKAALLLLKAAFFAESLGLLEAVGVALVLAGVVWVSREQPSPSQRYHRPATDLEWPANG